MTIMVFSAHPDDEVIGLGGTIAKMSNKEDVISVIFSLGDKYPFWKKKEEVIKTRKEETKKINEILGIKKTYFLGYKDTQLKKSVNDAMPKVKKLLLKYMPSKVFVHTITDGHPDHRAVNEIVLKAVKSSFLKTQVLTFDINFWNLSRNKIQIIYDVSKTFQKKIEALNAIKSQGLIIKLLKPLIILKAIYFGRINGFKYAECFKSI